MQNNNPTSRVNLGSTHAYTNPVVGARKTPPQVGRTQFVQAPRPVGTHAASQDAEPKKKSKRSSESRGSSSKKTSKGDKPNKGIGKGKIIAGVAASIIAVAYAAGAVAFSQIAYPNTKIAGVDVSFKTASSATDAVNSAWKNYSLAVSGDGFSWTFTPEGSESIINGKAAVDEIIGAENCFAWPYNLIKALGGNATESSTSEATVDLTAEIDTALLSDNFDAASFEEQLGAAIDQFNETRSGSFDAASAYDETTGQFSADKARSNEKLSRDNVIKFAEIKLSQLAETADLTSIGTSAYDPLNGTLTDENIQAACDAANGLLGVNVNLKLNGNVVSTVDGKTSVQWIKFDDALNPSLDSDAIKNWATELVKSFNTVGTTRTYTRADGKQCSVSGGTYGWSVDVDSTVTAISDAITNKQTGDIELSYKTKGDKYTAQGEPDWGAYIDVDLPEQHVRYYDESGNLLWESGCISGNPNKGNSTPTGVYCINSNNGASTLIGKKDATTGQPEYETPVSYWMPFEGNSVGFHDASWQTTANFSNPDAYKTVGSHGCINLPPSKAAELSSMIHTGLCVVVHN